MNLEKIRLYILILIFCTNFTMCFYVFIFKYIILKLKASSFGSVSKKRIQNYIFLKQRAVFLLRTITKMGECIFVVFFSFITITRCYLMQNYSITRKFSAYFNMKKIKLEINLKFIAHNLWTY